MNRFAVAYLAALLTATAVAFTALALVVYRWFSWPEEDEPGAVGETGPAGVTGPAGAMGATGATGTVLTLTSATAQFDTGGPQFDPQTTFSFRKYTDEDVVMEFHGIGNMPSPGGWQNTFPVLNNIPPGFAPTQSHTGHVFSDDTPWYANRIIITPTHIEMPQDAYELSTGTNIIGGIRYALT